MKETLPFWRFSSINRAIGTILNSVPVELVPKFMERPSEPIFKSLSEAAQDNPALRSLIGSIVREEVSEILQRDFQLIEPNIQLRLTKAIKRFPELTEELVSQELLTNKELFQLEHDVSKPITAILDKGDSIKSFRNVGSALYLYTQLRYRYYGDVQEGDNIPLAAAYSKLLREYSSVVVIPALGKAITEDVDFGNYELYEVRSAYRELAQISPTEFAEEFLLTTAISQFVGDRKFQDKNTKKPVEVLLDSELTNPTVYMDKGDLYRMLRNLLRDAVTHSEAPVIRPIIKVESSPECVYLSIFSQGELEQRVLEIIGREPYTTQDRGDVLHGYGKVGARKLLEELWGAVGRFPQDIERLMRDHWVNTWYQREPHVRWRAPLPYAG